MYKVLSSDALFYEIRDVAKFMFDKGWAERNAGNFSYRINSQDLKKYRNYYNVETELPLVDFRLNISEDKDLVFVISTSGSRFRDIVKDPVTNTCLVHISKNKSVVYTVSEYDKPSSEFPSHTLIHAFLSEQKPEQIAIVHTHPTNIIALSHKFGDSSKSRYNEILNSVMPEVSMFIKNGIGLVELLEAGSFELATETLRELQNHDLVIWKKHGIFCVAVDLWEAADSIDIVDKAAKIILLAQL